MNDENKVKEINPQKKDMITGLACLVLFVLFFAFSFAIPIKTASGGVTSRSVPQLVSVLGMLISAGLILKNGIPYVKQKKSDAAPEAAYKERKRWKLLAVSTVLMIGYIALMNTFGFILTSIVYLFLQMFVILEKPTKKRVILLAVIAISVPIILYIPFRYGFHLMVPVGTVFR